MKRTLILLLLLLPAILFAQSAESLRGELSFREGSTVLLKEFKTNSTLLASLEQWLATNYKPTDNTAYLRIVAHYAEETPIAINRAAVQASTAASYFRKVSNDKNFRYTFAFVKSATANRIAIETFNGAIPAVENQRIFFTESTDPAQIATSVARFTATAYISSGSSPPSVALTTQQTTALTAVQVVKSIPAASNNSSTPTTKPITSTTLSFRYGSEVIYQAYNGNAPALTNIKQLAEQNKTAIESGNGHLRIVSYIPQSEKDNPVAINFASIRGAVVRQWMMDNNASLTDTQFTFFISPEANRNAVEVLFINTPIEDKQQSNIFFTLDKGNAEIIDDAIGRYARVPYIYSDMTFDKSAANFAIIDPALDPTKTTKIEGAVDEQVLITLYYRVSKHDLDKNYLTNASTLAHIDSLLNLPSAAYIDTLRITAFASPEGNPDYNQKLSERRANTMRDYILHQYPKFANRQVIAEGKGMNWAGLQHLAEADSNLPLKAELLAILNNTALTQLQKQSQVQSLNGGRLYRDYLLPKYYPQLRSGASLFVAYSAGMPVDIDFAPIAVTITEPAPKPEPEPEPIVVIPAPEPLPVDTFRYIRPIAIKTNLLFDLATLFNVELELPIGRRFSILGEWTFPFWGGLGNAGGVAPIPAYSEKYTLQMLSGMLEGRYWFKRSEGLDKKAQLWGDYNPLVGWFAGLYGGAGLYDAQLGDHGMQGEFYIAAGLSIGFAHPIAKHFHLEYSAGAGYIATRYYNYTLRDGHKVVDIREDGKFDRRQQSLVGPTRLKVSLIWIPQFKVKGK